MVSPHELQRPMLALEFTKWNLIWISDELPLCELPRKLRAMVGTKTRNGRVATKPSPPLFCSAAGEIQYRSQFASSLAKEL